MSANADKRVPVFGENPRPPDCHSEPLGEESRFAQVYFALLELLRYRAGGQCKKSLFFPHCAAQRANFRRVACGVGRGFQGERQGAKRGVRNRTQQRVKADFPLPQKRVAVFVTAAGVQTVI